MFSRSLIFKGQIWRLITFIFVPGNTSIFWFALSMYFYWFIGSNLSANGAAASSPSTTRWASCSP